IVTGYVLTSFIVLLTLFGLLSFITHPIEAIDMSAFLWTTLRNIAFTAGLLIAFIVAVKRSKRGYVLTYIKTIFSSLTIGFAVIFWVTSGIIRALTRQPMQWFLVKKNGNNA